MDVVLSMNDDKTPVVDGFSFSFYKACWEVVQLDIWTFLLIFKYGRFVRSSNATLIVLIPGKSGATYIKDFLPINLASGMYKIIGEVLENRLNEVLGRVVFKF